MWKIKRDDGARVSAYSCLRVVALISAGLGGRLGLKLLLWQPEDAFWGGAIFSQLCGQSGRWGRAVSERQGVSALAKPKTLFAISSQYPSAHVSAFTMEKWNPLHLNAQ